MKTKKIAAISALAGLAVGGFATVALADGLTHFEDVPPGAYYEESVAWAVENGITNGISETQFGPHLGTDRAQVVTFLKRFNDNILDEIITAGAAAHMQLQAEVNQLGGSVEALASDVGNLAEQTGAVQNHPIVVDMAHEETAEVLSVDGLTLTAYCDATHPGTRLELTWYSDTAGWHPGIYHGHGDAGSEWTIMSKTSTAEISGFVNEYHSATATTGAYVQLDGDSIQYILNSQALGADCSLRGIAQVIPATQ